MATFSDVYADWRRRPFPDGGSDHVLGGLHADLALADTWVAESVIPYAERGLFEPAQIDVLDQLQALRRRAGNLSVREREEEYLAYVDALSEVYARFLEEGGSIATETIYVALVGEGVDVWRPVQARVQDDGTFHLPDRAPDGEDWQFAPGSIVRCELRRLADGETLVAVSRVKSSVPELLDAYLETAERWGTLQSEASAANTAFDENRSLYRLLRAERAGRDGIADLMQHADVHVRLLAASHSLGWAPGEASTVLEALEQEPGLHALTAKYTLRAYRSGKLNLD